MPVDSTPEVGENNHRKRRLVLRKSRTYVDRRCSGCGRLLCRELEKSQRLPDTLEIRCKKCKTLNVY